MSDDEYYADSPYDEFEEMLWDADPAPHLADDLAQHTAYSPVWQDDPVGELEPYYSDWEYYSDDYFDDDPQILKKNPLDGSPPPKKVTGRVQTRRGKKRRLSEAFEAVDSAEKASLVRSIQGTVWANNTTPNIKIFRNGEQEKVALLIDWRERFKVDAKRRPLSKREQLEQDESWANDLGLVDMGLTFTRESQNTQGDAEEDAGDGTFADGYRSDPYGEDNDGVLIEETLQQRSSNTRQRPPSEEDLDPDDFHNAGEDEEPRERKKPKVSLSKENQQDVLPSQISNNLSGRKKRRLSSTSTDGPESIASTGTRRAKRIASSKLGRT